MLQRLRRVRLSPLVAAVPSIAAMVVLLVIPLAAVMVESFLSETPFNVALPATLDNYRAVLGHGPNRILAFNSVVVGGAVATASVVIALPVVYWLRFCAGRWANPVLAVVLASMFASVLVRIYAWRTIFGSRGVVNTALWHAGFIDEPLGFLIFSRTAVSVAGLHLAAPYAVVILFASIRSVRHEHLEAAEMLGASGFAVWRRVVLPLMAVPIAAAWMFVFIVISSDFVTSEFLGGIEGQMIGSQVRRYLLVSGAFGKGAALSQLMILFYLVLFILLRAGLRRSWLDRVDW